MLPNTRCEPDTHSVLLGEFSKADCRRVFPKVASKAYKRHFKSLLDAIDFISSSDCPLSDADKQIHLQNKLDLLPALDAKDTTGLRLDALFENPITGNQAHRCVSRAYYLTQLH